MSQDCGQTVDKICYCKQVLQCSFAKTMELLDVVYRFLLGVLLETKRLDNIAIRSTKTEHTFVDRTQDKQCNEIYDTIGKLYFIRHARI